MIARQLVRSSRFRALALACALATGPRELSAQDDPTPFWMPASPQKDADKNPDDQPAKKRPPAAVKHAPPKTASHRRTSDGESGDESEDAAAAPKAKKKSKPAPSPPRKAKAKAPATEDSDVDESPAPAPAAKKHHYEPLPPLPHLEPEAPAQPQTQPYPAPYPAPNQIPAPRSYPAPQTNYPARPVSPPAQAAPANPGNYPSNYAPAQTGQVVVPIDEQRGAGSPAPDDEPVVQRKFRRFSFELLAGAWAKAASDGQSHDWQLAYGVDVGIGLFRWLQLDVRGLRSSGLEGNAYANATTSHLLFDGRLSGVYNFSLFSAFAGAGGGLVLEQTQLFLQDINSSPITLSSSGLEPVGEVALGLRACPWRGLVLRLEGDGLLRQGNFEPVLLFGAGWSL